MKKKLEKPSWYQEEFYNKDRTPEEWLYELWKRNQFQLDEINIPYSIHALPIQEQERYFIEFVLAQEIDVFLKFYTRPSPPQPIKYPSISDIFLMYHKLISSDWYKKCVFRSLPNTDSDASRTLIPISLEHRFQFYPNTHSGAFER